MKDKTYTQFTQQWSMANQSWRNVSAKTISNCFKKVGFVKEIHGEENENEEEENSIPLAVSSEQWNRLAGHMDLLETSFNDFTHFDDDISAYGNLSDEDIVAMNRRAEEDGGDDRMIWLLKLFP